MFAAIVIDCKWTFKDYYAVLPWKKECEIRYKNVNEDEHRTTDRAARSVVKVHDIEDRIINDDIKHVLEEVEKQFKNDMKSCVDSTGQIPSELDSDMIEKMKKQIKLDGVHVLEFNTKDLVSTTDTQRTDNLFSKEQLKICDDYVNKCLVKKCDKGSVFGSRYSEPDDCMVK